MAKIRAKRTSPSFSEAFLLSICKKSARLHFFLFLDPYFWAFENIGIWPFCGYFRCRHHYYCFRFHHCYCCFSCHDEFCSSLSYYVVIFKMLISIILIFTVYLPFICELVKNERIASCSCFSIRCVPILHYAILTNRLTDGHTLCEDASKKWQAT